MSIAPNRGEPPVVRNRHTASVPNDTVRYNAAPADTNPKSTGPEWRKRAPKKTVDTAMAIRTARTYRTRSWSGTTSYPAARVAVMPIVDPFLAVARTSGRHQTASTRSPTWGRAGRSDPARSGTRSPGKVGRGGTPPSQRRSSPPGPPLREPSGLDWAPAAFHLVRAPRSSLRRLTWP